MLELELKPDLVTACAMRKRASQRNVGFALEGARVFAQRTRKKLRRKGLDAIVADSLRTVGAEHIQAVVYTASGESSAPPWARKPAQQKEYLRAG